MHMGISTWNEILTRHSIGLESFILVFEYCTQSRDCSFIIVTSKAQSLDLYI